MQDFTIEPIDTGRLRLEPLTVHDAETVADVFHQPDVMRYIGGDEVSRDVLLWRFQRMPSGPGRDDELWRTWTVRIDGEIIGIVQATVTPSGADLAWVLGPEWWGKGYATEAAMAVRDWCMARGVSVFTAEIVAENAASNAVADRLGMRPTVRRTDSGEVIWEQQWKTPAGDDVGGGAG